MTDASALTAADIARLAGVSRAAVSNWRRRHADFPEPTGGTDASPVYDRSEVEAWLAARGALPELPPVDRLWRDVLEKTSSEDLRAAMARAAEVLMLAAAAHAAGEVAIEPVSTRRGRDRIDRDLGEFVAAHGSRESLTVLLGKYLAATGLQASATPKPVADLMAGLAVSAGAVVVDPACGTGELLAAAAAHGAARVIGQELNSDLAKLASTRLGAEAGPRAAHVDSGDSFLDDRLAGLEADVVLCHPPFGDRDWGLEELTYDSRWEYGIPPRAEAELAWVQHALAHLRPGGRAVMLMPPAAASRPSGRRVRAEMLRRGAIRAIASLPAGAAQPRNIRLHLWLLTRPAADTAHDLRVLFIDTGPVPDDHDGGGRRVAGDWQQAATDIQDAWAAFSAGKHADRPGSWQEVPVIDLLDETVDLTPARHVVSMLAGRLPEQTAASAEAARARLRRSLGELRENLPGGEWALSDVAPSWRLVTIGELARSDAVRFFRASAAAPTGHEPADGVSVRDGWPVLTVGNVLGNERASAAAPSDLIEPGWVTIHAGDVIIPAAVGGRVTARVVGAEDEQAILGRGLHLIRADPRRIDPWFLAGFLASPASIQQASYGSTATRIDVRRLTVPWLPLREQRRYGKAFLELHKFSLSSEQLAIMSATLIKLLAQALAEGGLLPGPRPV